MSIKREKIKVYDMTCTSCEKRIENSIKKINGVKNAKADYTKETLEIDYDSKLCNIEDIKKLIRKIGYSTESSSNLGFIGILIIIFVIFTLGLRTSGFDMESKLNNASYAFLFVVGIFTSIHCVGMCGGIMISQSLSFAKESKSKLESITPSLLYNLGRVLSYSILGGLIGGIGSVFSLSITAKAFIQIFAGLFMVIMGLNISGFKLFRKFSIKIPNFLSKYKRKFNSPFLVGFLNGFMPCGPLQTMQLFALGTGSALKGALSMFIFALGTVPLMLTFGAISGFLSKGYTKKLLKFSGVLIIVLGLIMSNRGLSLSGININPLSYVMASSFNSNSSTDSSKAILEDGVQIINMTANNNGYSPNVFYVQKGVPVKWVINGESLNYCNNSIVVNSLNIQQKLKSGENIIEFTPTDKDINFSCWMGMIRGVIKVVDDLDSTDTSKYDPSLPSASNGPSCCAVPLNNSATYPENLITTSKVTNEFQTAIIKGEGSSLNPLILVAQNNLKFLLTIDLNNYTDFQGEYTISNLEDGSVLSSFTGKKSIFEIELNSIKSGGYSITKNDEILGIIEFVEDVQNSDLDTIINKYINF
ncbi:MULTISPECIES: sulfite exporter TauE/SafE family protein [Clostridium]|jgi:sulfite exporter TauE/SafE/plastocyanin domain-containing protein/copper chaperone CopZ|uniref:Heavy metal-binding domain-containing protein n=1 Tax=Clostridium sartagoforme AAU1 TaxID=1202534 RepID=R9CEA5_9CLOT|nr:MULTISPECIES: sulfite exporter TauE/SafE family protein [Clostridium]EOR27684.1 heavy metal-binding domain-containing protein [Clostridium sartagoforme AAU1]KLE15794.1 heavy metal transport/detoxification protein [Clostridium sp. C8]